MLAPLLFKVSRPRVCRPRCVPFARAGHVHSSVSLRHRPPARGTWSCALFRHFPFEEISENAVSGHGRDWGDLIIVDSTFKMFMWNGRWFWKTVQFVSVTVGDGRKWEFWTDGFKPGSNPGINRVKTYRHISSITLSYCDTRDVLQLLSVTVSVSYWVNTNSNEINDRAYTEIKFEYRIPLDHVVEANKRRV